MEENESLYYDALSDDIENSEYFSACTTTGADSFLTGFLFGNVDNEGKLLDSELLDGFNSQLSFLQKLGLDEIVEELASEEEQKTTSSEGAVSSSFGCSAKVTFAQPSQLASSSTSYDFYDAEEDLSEEAELSECGELLEEENTAPAAVVEDSNLDKNENYKTPLSGVLPLTYNGRTVYDLYPEFRKNKVLNFSKLFGAGKACFQPEKWKYLRTNGIKKRGIHHETSAIKQAFQNNTNAAAARDDSKCEGNVADDDDVKRLSVDHKSFGGKSLSMYTNLPYVVGDVPHSSELESDDEESRFLSSSSSNKRPKVLSSKKSEQNNLIHSNNSNNSRIASSQSPVSKHPASFWFTSDFVNLIKQIKICKDKTSFNTTHPNEDIRMDYVSLKQLPSVVTDHWEDNIIYDKKKAESVTFARARYAGWIPTSKHKTLASFRKDVLNLPYDYLQNAKWSKDLTEKWLNIFPVENKEIIIGNWEDKIIFDVDKIELYTEPPEYKMNPFDENLILKMPEEPCHEDNEQSLEQTSISRGSRENRVKVTRSVLNRTGFVKGLCNENEILHTITPSNSTDNTWNLSNDEFYNPRLADAALRNVASLNLQHSTPAVQLHPALFPTHPTSACLRVFHRPRLKLPAEGVLADFKPHGVKSLHENITHVQVVRDKERESFGGGQMFYARTLRDLSCMDGELIFAEYSEEFPPLLNQCGMGLLLKNYYKRKDGKDTGPSTPPEYGNLAFAHAPPFLGSLYPGQLLQAFESHLFRAAAYIHRVKKRDFLIVRTNQGYFLRKVNNIFCVGQELPLVEVPGPNSKRANNFHRDFLQAFIYRLFWRSREVPKKIKIEDIRKAFPLNSESNIRKRLKLCADFKRTGPDCNWWVLRDEFRLPSEEEIRALVTPEQCCAQYSMLEAEQRLKDAGFGERCLFSDEEELDESGSSKVEDEIKCAPWHTSKAYIDSLKGKCLLQLNGISDPTGCGEGYAFIKLSNKAAVAASSVMARGYEGNCCSESSSSKKSVTGTDADLRRLHLKDARKLLSKFGIPDHIIRTLSRWEIVDVVRTMSTQFAKEGGLMTKFARGTRYCHADFLERYNAECQRIFDLQNEVLSCPVSPPPSCAAKSSTYNDEIEDENDERKTNLENMFNIKQQQQKKSSNDNRVLKIIRTYRDEYTGKEYEREEIVRHSGVIDTYIRVRETKSDQFIRHEYTLDENEREQLRRERRRIQEQLRRVRRNEILMQQQQQQQVDAGGGGDSNQSVAADIQQQQQQKSKKKERNDLKMKCGACGAIGHMRTNRECPLYSKSQFGFMGGDVFDGSNGGCNNSNVKEINDVCRSNEENAAVRVVSGTKLILSKNIIEKTIAAEQEQSEHQHQQQLQEKFVVDETKRSSLILHIPKDVLKPPQRKKRRPSSGKQDETLKSSNNSVETATAAGRNSTVATTSAAGSSAGTGVVASSSSSAAGAGSGAATAAVKRKQQQQTTKMDYLLDRPAKRAHRRRVDPLVSMSIILESIVNELREIPEARFFLLPVNTREVPDYYKLIENPIDLQTIRKRVQEKYYQNRESFILDMKLLVDNSCLYNGSDSRITADARYVFEKSIEKLAEQEEFLMKLEKSINPLLDDDDLVAMSYIFEKILNEHIMTVDNAWQFLKPVNRLKYRDYYNVIKTPMDLETISAKIHARKYTCESAFLADVKLLYTNSLLYNGENNSFTKIAAEMVEKCQIYLNKYRSQLDSLQQTKHEPEYVNEDVDLLGEISDTDSE